MKKERKKTEKWRLKRRKYRGRVMRRKKEKRHERRRLKRRK